MSYNPRYVNYARVHGHTPEEQMDYDRLGWPGAVLLPFIEWNKARLVEASSIIPEAFFMGRLTNHEIYDAWLSTYPANPVPYE